MKKWFLTNVVWYDGCYAYTSKFILKVDENWEDVTEESEHALRKYLDGNGEVLKIDKLYPVDFDEIVAFGNLSNSTIEADKEKYSAYERFKEMWF